MTPEFKTLAFELKAIEGENPNGEFEAILSTPDLDRDGETVTPRAFEPLPKSIPVHFSHDFVDKVPPVGRATPYYEGDVLKVKGTFASTARAQELRSLVNEGVIDSMSAGFLTTQKKGKSIVKGDLVEGSLTATPVNRSALLLRSKALAVLEAKAGARNSSSDNSRLQQIHDLAVENGAACPGMKSLEEADTKALDDEEIPSPEATPEDPAVATAPEAVATAVKSLAEAEDEKTALELRARALAMTAEAAAV